MSIRFATGNVANGRLFEVIVNERLSLRVTVTADATVDASLTQRWIENVLNVERNESNLAFDHRVVVSVGVRRTTRETEQCHVADQIIIYQVQVAQYVPMELRQLLVNADSCLLVAMEAYRAIRRWLLQLIRRSHP